MKQKIKEALRQEYKSRLELDDERLDGVAAFASTFVTDEAKIEEFVKNEATLAMLKSYQSVVDKDRAKRKAEPKPNPQPSDPGNQPNPEPKPELKIDEIIAKAVAASQIANNDLIAKLQDRIDSFEKGQTAKAALESAKAQFFGNDYVKKYGDEASDAWDVAMLEYKYNPEWTQQQINEAAMGRFNKSVAKKGVDTTKPFESDGGGGEAELDMTKVMEIYKKSGRVADK